MLTLILAAGLLILYALCVEKNNTTAILTISAETMILVNLTAVLFNGVPAFLAALIIATILVLVTDTLANERS